MKLSIRPRALLPPKSAFAGFRVPAEVIDVAVRWYPRFNLSYRDVEELLVERGVEVDHVTSTDGCKASRRCRPTPPGSPATHRVTGGSWMRHTPRSTAGGATCIGPSPADSADYRI